MSKDLTIEALKAGDQKTYARLYTAYKKDFISFAHKFKIWHWQSILLIKKLLSI